MRSYVNALEILSEKFVMIDRERKKKDQFCVPINKDSPLRRLKKEEYNYYVSKLTYSHVKLR